MATVHLINTFGRQLGGAQWRTLTLFELLSEQTEVNLWSEAPPIPWLVGKYPVKQITPQQFPRGGNLVFIGAYYRVSGWVKHSNPKRVILLFNSNLLSDLEGFVRGFADAGLPPVELAFASEGIRSQSGIDAPIHVSPISRQRFRPNPSRGDLFTVGRMGRNDWTKHHPDDPSFFQELLNRGYRVRIMGCEAKTWGLDEHPNLELLEMNQECPEIFLNSLHTFFYRGHPDWYETFGRVNLEAMCTGIPVVAESRHGYVDYLQNGCGGFLYDTEEQAFELIESLRNDADLWAKQSGRALSAADAALSPDKINEVLQFYSR